jgi:phospholipase C
VRTFSVLFVIFGLVATGGILTSFNGCAGSSTASLQKLAIQHIVIIVQENRTPDNLFRDPVLIARGADIAQSGLDSSGQTLPLIQGSLVTNWDLSHAHPAFEDMYDGGKMDGANLIPIWCFGVANCQPPPAGSNPQFMYINPSEVQPYFHLAEQYTFGDRMFQTNQGPSFPAHQFLFGGTSAPTATSNLFASENIVGNGAGCNAQAGATVKLINPQGVESSTMYPCFEHQTLADLLAAKGISWRYYAPSASFLWTAPDAIQHICQPQTQNGKPVCTGSEWSNVIIPQTGVLSDIANNQLAQVSWVVPTATDSDHAGTTDGSGPSWVASIVNAIGNSSYWKNTAIIITWDDWGGWYDHVAPPKVLINCTQWGCGYVYGFRVPLIVVSPYAKTKYISHVDHDFGSILNFVEKNFGLSSLGYADSASNDDLSDCFNFQQNPTAFQAIAAPLNADYFLHDPNPPADPDND